MPSPICPTPIKWLGILGIVLGTSLILSGLGTWIGAFSQIPEDPETVYLFRFTVVKFLALGLASIVLGAGLLEAKRWAWFGTLAFCMLGFMKFPLGTVIGISLIVYLFRHNVREFFDIRGFRHRPFR
jgi:uncharacterized membrane protein YphA (DoxX/SURF4 family)